MEHGGSNHRRKLPRQSMEAVLAQAGEIRESVLEGSTLELNFEAGRSWPGVKERAVTRPPCLLTYEPNILARVIGRKQMKK